MASFETDLSQALEELADDMDPDGPRRVAEGIALAAVRRRRRKFAAAGSGVAAVALAVSILNVTGVIGDPASTPAAIGHQEAPKIIGNGPDFVLPPLQRGEPCPFAERLSPSELASRVDVPVWMPDAADASVKNLSGAWWCGGAPLLTFTSGVQVWYESGWGEVADIEKKWAGLVAEDGEGEVATVLDRPALLRPISKTFPKGELLVAVDDTLITVYGDGTVPLEQLVEVAESIDLSNPIPPE